jgi:hypothetical protein
MGMNRCAARGCGRWTRAGQELCTRHFAPAAEPGDDEDAAPGSLAAFRARLAAGNYDAVLGPGLRGTLRGAAADAGLEAEIGALRLALARLLQEEGDPTRLAAGVARVAGVSVQAARLRLSGEGSPDDIRGALVKVLAEFEAEQERKGGQRGNATKGGEEDDVDGGGGRMPSDRDA